VESLEKHADGSLSGKEAAPYFARIAKLYFDFSQRIGAAKENEEESEKASELNGLLFRGLELLGNKIQKKEDRLHEMLGGGHGIVSTTKVHATNNILRVFFEPPPRNKERYVATKYRRARLFESLKFLQFNNGLFWGSMAKILDGGIKFSPQTYKLDDHRIYLDEAGNIGAKSDAWVALFRNIPHVFGDPVFTRAVKIGFKSPESHKSVVLSMPQSFVLFRSVSNAFHLQKMEYAFMLLKKGIRAFGHEDAEMFLNKFYNDGEFYDRIAHPSNTPYNPKTFVINSLISLKNKTTKMRSEKAGAPEGVLNALRLARHKPEIEISVGKGGVRVRNTGFSGFYHKEFTGVLKAFERDVVGEVRHGSSTYYQQQVARIRRRITENGAITELRFRKAA
ncbi:MAG: hypothetical protein V1658_02340, partial [Candidatus Micrarchaeota archaeon]